MIKTITKSLFVLVGATMVTGCVEDSYYSQQVPHHYHRTNYPPSRVINVAPPSTTAYSVPHTGLPPQVVNTAPPSTTGYPGSFVPREAPASMTTTQ